MHDVKSMPNRCDKRHSRNYQNMSSSEVSDLHKVWLKFLNTTKTDDGETWLDKFLAKYLSLLCSPSINTNNSFSFQWKSSGNILAHQLLSDMYEICEKVKICSLTESDSSLVSEPFKKYLLEGRGWQILWALENIGIHNLLCLKDLIKLLILHVPVLLSLPVCQSTIPVSLQRKPKSLNLNTCFIITKRNRNIPHNTDFRWPENYAPKKKRNFIGKKRVRRKKMRTTEKDSSSSSGEDKILFEPVAIPASQLRSLQKINRISTKSASKSMSDVDESDQDFSYFDSCLPSQIQDFRCYNISVIDYMHFILNLFQESSQLDRKNSEYMTSTASLVLEFALNTLKDIHNGRYGFQGWSKEDVDGIRDHLLKLVFLSATVTYSSLSYTGAPNENEVISTLITICNEISTLVSDDRTKTFICDVVKGCLMLITNTIELYSGDYAKFICIIRTFTENGARLCYNTILYFDKEESEANASEIHSIISLVKEIIVFLKYEKMSLLHSEHYNSGYHVKDFIHHHNDAFGSYTNYIDMGKEQICCIASISCMLFEIFNLPISRNASVEVLKQLKTSGICCCMNLSFIFKALFSRFGEFDCEVQHLILVLIEKQLFSQLGLTLKSHSLCSNCSKRLKENDVLSWPQFERFNDEFQAANPNEILMQGAGHGTTFWSCFNTYNDLLNLLASETIENITKHLKQIFLDGAIELKSQLFIRVVLPQFLLLSSTEVTSFELYSIKSKCFLSILQVALQDVSFSAIFVNFKGIPALHPFLLSSDFRQLSLDVLKILIFSENESHQELDDASFYSAITCVPASSMFCGILLENTEIFSKKISSLLLPEAHSKSGNSNYVSNLSEEFVYCICDIWKCYKEVISIIKNDYFHRMSEKVFDAGYNLFIILLENLDVLLTVKVFKDKQEMTKRVLLLTQSLLSICIKMQKDDSTKLAILATVKQNLMLHAPKHVDYQILLFDLALKCCFSSASTVSSFQSLSKNKSVVEVLDETASSEKDLTGDSSYGESYAADTEGSSSCIFQNSMKYEMVHHNYIEHGEVVKMLFELFMHFQKDSICDWIPPALYILQNLIKLCQECELNKKVLCKQDIPLLLLESFSNSLTESKENIYDFQKAALDLFVVLSEFSIRPNDLRKIFGFFKSSNAPVALLLKCLNTMLDSMTIHPTHTVSFPCLRKSNMSNRMKKRLKTAYNIHSSHSSFSNVSFGWTYGALCFPITEDTKWNAFNKGHSFALWLKLNNVDPLCPLSGLQSSGMFNVFKRQTSEENEDLFTNNAQILHIASIGSDKFLLELWYDKLDRDLIVRITSINNGEIVCLSKGVCKSFLQASVWHHLVVNYSESSSKSNISSRIQVILDGHTEPSEMEKSLTFPAYSIGSFMFFKGDILTRDIVFYLASLGPNVKNIIDCAIQQRNSFVPKLNAYQYLTSLVSLDIYTGVKAPSLEALQNSILCTYVGDKMDSYLVYHNTTRGFFSIGSAKGTSSQQDHKLPSELQVLTLGNVSILQLQGFQYAFHCSGGVTNLVFLFAYLLEHGCNEKDASEALNLILKILNKNTVFSDDFIRIKGYELLNQMIISKKCPVSIDLFQVLQQNSLTFCLSNENLKNNFLKDSVKQAVISNGAIFSLMLNSISIAQNTPNRVLSSLFTLLNLLLDPKTAYVQINVKQMNSVQVLNSLLWLLKRNYIMAEKFFPVSVAKMIPNIMQKLLHQKFDKDIFKNICNFLLMLHKSSETYICHSRSSFFFFYVIDKIECHKKERLKTQHSSVFYADDVEKYFPLQTDVESEFLFKRSSSYPDQSSVWISEEDFPKPNKIKSVNSIDTVRISEETGASQFPFQASQDKPFFTNKEFGTRNNTLKATQEYEASEICISLLDLIHYFIGDKTSPHFEASLQLLLPEIFLVLAYTVNSEVCISAVKIIKTYLKEANENVQSSFLNIKGFHLLANQLYQRPFDEGVFDACFSMIFDSPLLAVNLSRLFNQKEFTSFEVMSWLPLLAMLPKTYANPLVCEQIILVLTKFLKIDSAIIFNLLENGLGVSLSHLIIQIAYSSKVDASVVDLLESDPCLKVISDLLIVVSTELCSSKRAAEFLAFCDVLHLFSDLEQTCIEDYGPESSTSQCLRNCQCIMFEVVIKLSQSCKFHASKPITLLRRAHVDDLESEVTEGNNSSNHNEAQGVLLEIPMSEVVNRFETLLEKAVYFIVFKDSHVKLSSREREFIKNIFMFCIKGLAISINKNMNVNKTEYSALMCSLKDCLKKELSSLLISLLSSQQDVEVQEYVIEILATHPFNKKIIHLVVFSMLRVENFIINIDSIRSNCQPNLKKNISIVWRILQKLLQDKSSWNVLKNFNRIEKLKAEWIKLWTDDRQRWITVVNGFNQKFFQKLEILAQNISSEALNVTERVFQLQNNERKSFMEDLKLKYYEEASERRAWFNLVGQVTHENAVWHIPDSYPRSWELDPTEGPLRTRRRLKRCYIDVEPRFLRPEYTDKLVNTKDLPFLNLLLHHNEFPDSAAVLHRLHSHEQIEYTSNCKIVTAFEESKVEILIGACCIHIIGEEGLSTKNKYPISESWPFEVIKEIVPRRYELQNNAFELFLTNGLTYLIAFNTEREFQYIWRQLKSHNLPCQNGIEVATLTQLWREGSITNFEYLTQLNKLSGRSFNDLMQYPVFPYILADYVNPYLNLLNPSVYRNLEKPVAVQQNYREKFYKQNYELLKEQSCGPFSESELPISGPYHYGSHYSNSGSVLHFLIRLLPYTYSFIKYQDNNFDIPDRAFHSIETSWQLVTKDSTSDVKELIPEFFFLPEFLTNKNGFDFGVRQSGIRVNEVLLPPWCKQNPRLFILIHRQALESKSVTKNIHNWIDLVFGYKQTGEAAINAINVFHPATYYGLDINQWKDPITRQALKVMIKTLGQMPRQLFSSPHPMVSLSLASLDLTDEDADAMEVVDTVKGLRWGDFVGSPSTGAPNLVWCRNQNVVLGSFLPLLTNYMFGLGENICLLLNQKKNNGSDISSASYIMSAALVSWGHKDGIIRIKLCRDQPAVPLLQGNSVDPVCLCASVPDCKELFIGHSSGLIYVYSLCLGSLAQTVTQDQPPLLLNAHTDSITSIYICKVFSIFVSASKDGSTVIWDLNKLSFVRSLEGHQGAVQLVTVSDTLGDIASSSNTNDGSYLSVHTINGEAVGNVKVPDTITALCYSTSPEGISVNLIATGLHSGNIRLWSSWDLKPVREIFHDRFRLPIKCIVFSADNQHLFASNENGVVAVWEKPSKGLTSVPRLLVFT
ncbi:hypothetical protein JTE90_004345 [Oedothorax gibbosus]|uniref:Lysosomal-trafficking regulator n=1 Tax=Oedothorax gibbosus TaxID=931172 RepID=A0AAV6VMC2_9ARAC|nr:hypothetical protein JTE90_004345 [Oedothorax gibbosus]